VFSQPLQQKPADWVDVLRSDPRLKVPVTLKFGAMPASEEVLDGLQKATGVPLSWASQTEKGKATFGNAVVSNMPAWKVMEILAAKQVADGRWEKSGDGYTLHGTPLNFGPRPDSEKAKADKKAYEDQIAKAAKAREDFAKYHPLGIDEKLHARLTVVEMRPKLRDLLGRLSAASGLKFTLGDNVAHHDPDLGSFQLKDTRIYSFMEIIAERGIDNGRWEKIEGGYRLTGISHTPLPPSRFRWAWLAIPLGVVRAASGAFILYRRRGKKTAATSPNA
jgi:hypothetical protein